MACLAGVYPENTLEALPPALSPAKAGYIGGGTRPARRSLRRRGPQAKPFEF